MFEGLKFPANAGMVIETTVQLATLDIIDTDFFDEAIYYWPEVDAFSVNFEQANIKSLYFLANIGFSLYLIYLNILLIMIHACLSRCKKRA